VKTVMVSGSRDWVWDSVIRKALNEEWTHHNMRLIQGAARGADLMARSYALNKNWEIVDYHPNYTDFGKAATHIRNLEMVNQKPDIALFFVRDMSSGTMTTLEKVVKARIKFRIFYHDDYAL
jgi:hypothetical protein